MVRREASRLEDEVMYGNYGAAQLTQQLASKVTERLDPNANRFMGFWDYYGQTIVLGGMTFVGNPLIVKHFRPQDSYLKRVIIGFAADTIAGLVLAKVIK